jgi:Family of unknown function (DUF6932)
MPLPDFNANGDLPPGIHRATMEEVATRFGGPGTARRRCTINLRHIFNLARATRQFERMIVFGSYVSAKSSPNDVDVILVMNDTFNPLAVAGESRRLFDHAVAQSRFGASVFWITEEITLGEPVDVFVSHWQRKRGGGLRGIVEIVS